MMKLVQVVVLLLLLSLVLASGLTLSVSESKAAPLQPHAAESFTVGYIQMKNTETCSYTVVISTSCSSPIFTKDQISIAFGDAYGNQIYAPRLDDPTSRTFERCSSDTFKINGPCANEVCYVYLYRSGLNGWKPESVVISGDDSKNVTFFFDTVIPNGTWYGYNMCETPPPPSSSYRVSTHKWLTSMVLGVVLSIWW